MGSVSNLQNRVQSSLAKRPALVNLRFPSKSKADLFSNDFLSLSADTRLRSMVLNRLSNERGSFLGATGSRMLDGNTAIHVSFEAKLRDYYNADAALLFNSGYDANVGVFGTLPDKGDVVVYDELIHASVHDGIRFSQAAKSSYAFHHNSVLSLKSVLDKLMTSNTRVRSGSCTVFVALETVYSMDGDVAPLQELLEVVEKTLRKGCSQIFIDESHSAGVYGPEGRGLVSHMGLEKRVDIRLYTFSKALAGSGAVVICSPSIRTYLINGCRPFIYSTALNRICIIAAEASLDIVRSTVGDQLRERLFMLVKYAHNLLKKELHGIPDSVIRVPTITNSELLSVVIPIVTPNVVPLCLRLRSQGWGLMPIVHPAVPRGEERIRLTLHAGNTEQEIKQFVRAILDIIREGDCNEILPQGTVLDEGTRITARL